MSDSIIPSFSRYLRNSSRFASIGFGFGTEEEPSPDADVEATAEGAGGRSEVELVVAAVVVVVAVVAAVEVIFQLASCFSSRSRSQFEPAGTRTKFSCSCPP